MPNKEFRESKFTYDADEIKVVGYSQCSDCANNNGLGTCSMYGRKPDEYVSNKKDCPSKEKG